LRQWVAGNLLFFISLSFSLSISNENKNKCLIKTRYSLDVMDKIKELTFGLKVINLRNVTPPSPPQQQQDEDEHLNKKRKKK
jgi:hypothetical protein